MLNKDTDLLDNCCIFDTRLLWLIVEYRIQIYWIIVFIYDTRLLWLIDEYRILIYWIIVVFMIQDYFG